MQRRCLTGGVAGASQSVIGQGRTFSVPSRCIPWQARQCQVLLLRPQHRHTTADRQRHSCVCRSLQLASGGVDQHLAAAWQAFQASPHRDYYAAGIALAGALSLIKMCDTFTYHGWVDKKLSRKLVHMLAGPGFAICWPLFSSASGARFLAMAVPGLNLLRLVLLGTGVVEDDRTVKAMSREGDRRELLRGPLYYVVVLMASTILFWRASPVGLLVLALMCGGDGLADIVGRRWGGTARLPWNPAKSWAGSAAMFAGGAGMALAFIAWFRALGYFACDMGVMVRIVAIIAALATLTESLPVNHKVDDNLSVPLVAAGAGLLLVSAAGAA